MKKLVTLAACALTLTLVAPWGAFAAWLPAETVFVQVRWSG